MTRRPLNVLELEKQARAKLDAMTWSYYAGGARGQSTLRDNPAAWQRHKLRPRVLVDVSRRDLSTTVLGQPVSMPIVAAPMAFQRLAHQDGELAMVRATSAAETIMVLSSLATTSMEEVCAAANGPVWFQLYVYKDRGITKALIERAKAAGCKALVVTVDAPVLGTREADVRHGLHLPANLNVSNVTPYGVDSMNSGSGESGLGLYVAKNLAADLTWRDIEGFCADSGLPVLVKGVLRGDDGAKAIAHGAAGVIVSNHGGRQLDGAVATADVLEEVVQAVAGAGDVLVDGGIRRGTDVLKALALGARAVLVGRPLLWGLAHSGQDGVSLALSMLREELDESMALCGAPTIDAISRDLVIA